ncbi:MAG: cyclic nucleotide-binding/CBS domain-containing protein [Nanoarchaeota archaeon]
MAKKGIHMFLAEDIMTREVETISPSASLTTVSQKMAKERISSLIVTEKKKPLGIISERDFIRKVLARGGKKSMKVKDVMSSPVLSVQPRESITNAAKLMHENEIRHLLVTQDGEIKGIITETDLLRGESEYVKAHQFLQNLIMALFITILILFIVFFRIQL